MVPLKYKKKLLTIITQHAPHAKIYLFGSRTQKQHGERSDIDIALDIGSPMPSRVIGNIKEDIENSNIIYFVDVVDMRQIPKDMLNDIIEEGIKWKN